MRSVAIATLVLALVTAVAGTAHATDEARFEALFNKYAVNVNDLAPGSRKPFVPKSACVCTTSGINLRGIVVFRPNTGSVACGIVTFNTDGSLFGLDVTCNEFLVLGK